MILQALKYRAIDENYYRHAIVVHDGSSDCGIVMSRIYMLWRHFDRLSAERF